MRARPESITYLMPGTVSEVSATLVASTMRRALLRWNTRSCSCADRRANSGRISACARMVLAQILGASRISRSPGRNTSISPCADNARDLVHRIDDRLRQLGDLAGLLVFLDRAVAHLHRIHAPGHLDHRRIVEVAREALRIDGGRGDDELQIRAPGQQPLQIAEQEIDVQAALVRLVDDDGVVGARESDRSASRPAGCRRSSAT